VWGGHSVWSRNSEENMDIVYGVGIVRRVRGYKKEWFRLVYNIEVMALTIVSIHTIVTNILFKFFHMYRIPPSFPKVGFQIENLHDGYHSHSQNEKVEPYRTMKQGGPISITR